MKQTTSIVWFKRDLRVNDHAPLTIAKAENDCVIPLYIFEPELWQQPDSAYRQWQFINDSLQELDQELSKLGQPLVFHLGSAIEVFKNIFNRMKITNVYAHEETGNNWTYKRDENLRNFFRESGVGFHEFPTNGVVRRLPNRNQWSSYHKKRMSQEIVQPPNSLRKVDNLESQPFQVVGQHYFHRDSFNQIQSGGRSKGIELVKSFAERRAKRYRSTLSSPLNSHQFSSRLSSHLTYGTLSVKEVFNSFGRFSNATASINDTCKGGIQALLGRLHWRCHFIQKLEDEPKIETHCMHPYFEGMRETRSDSEILNAWFEGRTGYPIVDAVMRCLHQTGWINFRMRAMVTSFASYDLWLDWRETGPLLARLFTDYEPGIHYSQMQMQSGVTGINTFRIYNPIKQSQDHDPEGIFIQRYVPELQNVPKEFLHEPWKIPSDLKNQYKFDIGKDYPAPIIDHKLAIKQARKKIGDVLGRDGFREESQQVYEKLGSRKSRQSRPFKQRKSGPKKESRQLQFEFMNEKED